MKASLKVTHDYLSLSISENKTKIVLTANRNGCKVSSPMEVPESICRTIMNKFDNLIYPKKPIPNSPLVEKMNALKILAEKTKTIEEFANNLQ